MSDVDGNKVGVEVDVMVDGEIERVERRGEVGGGGRLRDE